MTKIKIEKKELEKETSEEKEESTKNYEETYKKLTREIASHDEISDLNQPVLNIGIVGHIDHGKTTLLHRLTGIWADKHSEELKRGITIKLGYADLTLRKCSCGKFTINQDCPACGCKTKEIKQISFVDAPGHEMLMATMLGGAAIIDAALLVISASEQFPQPQTKEHFLALQVRGIKNIIIVQNKVDLVTKEQAINQFKKIKEFLKETFAENAEIIPICAQQGANIDELLCVLNELPLQSRDVNSKPAFLIARTFDINKPGTKVENLHGGVLGGTLKKGKLKIGDIIEIKPGIEIKKHNQTIFKPVETKIIGLVSGGKKLNEIIPSGLIAIETSLDPMMTKSDSLAGCSAGLKGTIPEITTKIKMKPFLFKEISLNEKEKPIIIEPLKTNEHLLMSVNTTTTVGLITSARKDIAELSLKIPIVPNMGDRIGIARNYSGHWRLIGWAELIG